MKRKNKCINRTVRFVVVFFRRRRLLRLLLNNEKRPNNSGDDTILLNEYYLKFSFDFIPFICSPSPFLLLRIFVTFVHSTFSTRNILACLYFID